MNLNDIVSGVAYELTGIITGRFPDRVSDDVEFEELYETLLDKFYDEAQNLYANYEGYEASNDLDDFCDNYLDEVATAWAHVVSGKLPSKTTWEVYKLILEIITCL